MKIKQCLLHISQSICIAFMGLEKDLLGVHKHYTLHHFLPQKCLQHGGVAKKSKNGI